MIWGIAAPFLGIRCMKKYEKALVWALKMLFWAVNPRR
jgi:hypothetical protein